MIKLESASKQTTQVVSSLSRTPFGVGTSHGHFEPQDSPRPELGSMPPPYSLIVYSATLRRTHIQVALFPGTSKLESRNPTKCPGSGLPGLWEVIAPRPDLGSQRGLNRSCSPRRDLSNDVLHSRIGHWELVDSRLLVVGSQIASLGLQIPNFSKCWASPPHLVKVGLRQIKSLGAGETDVCGPKTKITQCADGFINIIYQSYNQ